MNDEEPLYEDRIIRDPKILIGKPVTKGTRIPVSLTLNLLANGADNAEIKSDYPGLTDEDIKAAITFAADCVDREANTVPRSL
jgi:uncharacterized protein (DUF433 family)